MICYLHIISWDGISPGATHFFGTLHCDGQEHKLLRPMTERDAIAENKKARQSGYRPNYAAGHLTDQWNTTEELHACAIAVYRDIFPHASVLIVAPYGSGSPHPCLHAVNPDHMATINRFADQAAAIGYYDSGHADQMKVIFGGPPVRDYRRYLDSQQLRSYS